MKRGPAPLRVAVIGLGFGSIHVAAFRQDARCEVVALCGRQLERVEAATRTLNIPGTFTDWRAVLARDEVNAVSLALPATVQAEVGLAALQAGKHVFFEKPLANTLAAAKPLAAFAHAHPEIVTAINFEFPEIPAFRDAKHQLEAGSIGALRHVAVTWRIETYGNRARVESWKSDSAAGGGALNLFGSHVFYYLEWLFGPVATVSASLARQGNDARPAETLIALSLVSRAGVAIVVNIATDAYQGPGHRIEVYGDDGTLVIENRTADYVSGFELQLFQRSGDTRTVGSTMDPTATPGDGRVFATAAVVRRFVDAIQHVDQKTSLAPNVMDGLQVQRLMDATRRSSELRRVVDVAAE